MTTPEGRVKTRLRRALAKSGILLWQYWPVPRGYGMATLDCLLCVNGYFVAVETKAPGGKVTPRQAHTIEQLRKAGATVLVIDDDCGIATLVSLIKSITK